MPKVEILHRWTNAIIASGEYTSKKHAVEENKADLTGADLRGADLRGADLTKADLRGADLRGADLRGADLTKGNLRGADLTKADLTEADLTETDLAGANLTKADLTRGNLTRGNLRGANLTGANLTRADLAGANLTGGNLTGVRGINPYLCSPLLILLDQPNEAMLRAYKLVNKNWEGHIKGGIRYEIGKRIEVKNANTNTLENCGAGINVATLDWCMREWREGFRILIVEFTKEDIACIPIATDGKFRLHGCTPIAEKNLKEIGLIK